MIDNIMRRRKFKKLTNHKLVLGKATVLVTTYLLLCLWGKIIEVRKVVDLLFVCRFFLSVR